MSHAACAADAVRVCWQEEEEAEEEEEARTDGKSLRDSIASLKWLREREGGGWPGGSGADPIKQQKLQQVASIKKCVWSWWKRFFPCPHLCPSVLGFALQCFEA